jgi:hypothetical protein
MAAADALYEIMSLMVKKGPLSEMVKEKTGGVEVSVEKEEI